MFTWLWMLCLIPAGALGTTGAAGSKPLEPERWFYYLEEKRVAAGGYDVVAYVALDKAVEGRKDLVVRHQGLTYRFAEERHRALFERDPQKYLPQYGGWCAFGVGVDERKYGFGPLRFPPDPRSFKIIGGKLYVFAKVPSFDAKAKWEQENEAEIIARADAFWADREAVAQKIGRLPEGMSPAAPMETAQFRFLIGKWKTRLRWMRDIQSREYGPTQEGIWSASFASQGYAIMDEWIPLNGGSGGGPTFRSFDPRTKKWVMTYIPVNQPRERTWLMEGAFDERGELEGAFEGVDPLGRKYMQKVFFYDIHPDRFTWRADRSYDGGKTWIESISIAESERLE